MLGCYICNASDLIRKRDQMSSFVEVRHIIYSYPGNTNNTLNNCSLYMKKGDMLCILGPNGIGKSTLLNCICGLLVPKQGEILINNLNINKMTPRSIAQHIGYVQQSQIYSFGYTIIDYVLMGRANNVGLFHKPSEYDRKKAEDALKLVGINHIATALITEVSGGERQLASIARVIAQEPQIILLDEPTAHLDYGNQIRILKLIKTLNKRGYSILMTTHNPDHCIMLNARVGIFDKTGTLTVGICEQMLSDDKLSELFGARIRMVYAESVKRNTFVFENIED